MFRNQSTSLLTRHLRGASSAAAILGVPLGSWWCRGLDHLKTPERQSRGLIIVLPGVEGKSALNLSLARGIAEGGAPHAIEIFDWTTGWLGLSFYHLFATERLSRQAKRLAEKIRQYQDQHPQSPVHLVGHSGGTAAALLALQELPKDSMVESALLLAAAVSPSYDLRPALKRTKQGIWNFYSPFDLLQLGAGTLLLGTVDRQHTFAAGCCGFKTPQSLNTEDTQLYQTKLHQQPFRAAMALNWNFGGHLGPTNRLFAAKHLAPLLTEQP